MVMCVSVVFIYPRPKWSVPAVQCSVHCKSTAIRTVQLECTLPVQYTIHCTYTLNSLCSLTGNSVNLRKSLIPGSVVAVYTAQNMQPYVESYTACTLQLHCMYTPLRSGMCYNKLNKVWRDMFHSRNDLLLNFLFTCNAMLMMQQKQCCDFTYAWEFITQRLMDKRRLPQSFNIPGSKTSNLKPAVK